MDFSFAPPIPSCDTDSISFDHTLPELSDSSNYGNQAVVNVFEHFNETPVQLEMSISDRQTKSQATIGDQAVIHSGSPSPSQLLPCGLDGCQMSFRYRWKLEDHQRFHAKHHWVVSTSPFRCECEKQFAKLDTLQRHIRKFQSSTRDFVCKEPGCAKAFQRKDHLVQHLRHGHHYSDAGLQEKFPARQAIMNVKPICHFTSCPYYRDAGFRDQPLAWQEENKPFAKQADYTKHMRDAHEWSPYPCDVPSCDKKDKKGYFSQKALLKHRQEQHPEAGAEPLVVKSPPAKRFPCGLPGCHVKLRPGSLFEHRSLCRNRSDEDRATLNERYLNRG
ncbi:CROL alpha [Apiospora arundinis]|uniref:CROL alpha n=1 Tax=Apiospora arundinis TaxID=335852 RepID=A0ABR2JB74_9PEZI